MEEETNITNEPTDLENMISLVKEALSIVSTATIKDNEITLWIQAAVEDLSRAGVTAATVSTENWLVKGAIVMYCKANFGMCSLEEKKLAANTYSLLCNNLSLSYKVGDDNV